MTFLSQHLDNQTVLPLQAREGEIILAARRDQVQMQQTAKNC
jgi:hypothetical protein